MVYNISKICRVCMEDGVYDILTSIFDDDYSVHISSKIMACAQVQVVEGDGLPTFICNKCADKVNIAYQFKQQCEYSDLMLREIIERNKQILPDGDMRYYQDDPNINFVMKLDNERLEPNHVFKVEPLNSENVGAEMEVEQNEANTQNIITNTIIESVSGLSATDYEIAIANNVFDEHDNISYEYLHHTCLDSEQSPDQFDPLDLDFDLKSEQTLKRRTRQVPKKIANVENYVASPRKKNIKVKCRVCAVSMSPAAMTVHMQRVHNEQAIFCKICGKQFSEKTGLAGHMKSHAKTKSTCTICEATFFSAQKLVVHMQKIHHNSSNIDNLEQEQQKSKSKKARARKFICACGHAVSTPSKLASHMKTHQKEKQINMAADTIENSTEGISETLTDMTNEVKRYSCSRCSKSFHEKGSLVSHEKTHDGLREYICKTCGRGFTHCSALRTHQRIHNGELPYVCSYCQRRFRTSGDMNEHIRRAHTFERPFACLQCDLKFVSSSDLARHSRSHKVKQKQAPTSNLDSSDLFFM